MFHTLNVMTQLSFTIPDIHDYAALRQSGTQPWRVASELGLDADQRRRLEAVFLKRAARGAGDRQLPKFARHTAHCAAVMAQGGYPAFSERRTSRGAPVLCLPVTTPTEVG